MPAPEYSLLHQAAEIIRRCDAGQNADAVLREFSRQFPDMNASHKRELARAVFCYFRWYSWLDQGLARSQQVAEARRIQGAYERDPKSIKKQSLPARAVPAWILEAIDFSVTNADGTANETATNERRYAWLRSLQSTPPLWIRARPGTAPSLAATLGKCAFPEGAAQKLAPDALHFAGATDLFRTGAYQNGGFQVQDLASQAVSTLCAPQPGETWWDACSGEGGKSLHLADLMQNKGTVWCSDRSLRRLETLRQRFKRVGLFNYRVAAWENPEKLPTKTKFDGVLVDAPCSGVGTWARNPDARWTATEQDVTELSAVQTKLLDQVAGSVKPGGKLVYAVCTLTRRETTDIATAFSATHPEFEPVAVPVPKSSNPAGISAPTAASSPACDLRAPLGVFLWPQDLQSNGMFLSVWQRRR